MNARVLTTFPEMHVALVTLNRPEAANAVDAELACELGKAVRHVENDPSVRVVILAGTGPKAFCAGADLKVIAAGQRATLYSPDGGFAHFVESERRKPWIAVVDAPALAGGLEIALACDFIIASAGARFALPEVKRGLIAAAGGIFRLPRRISRGAAFEMITTGEAIGAEAALMCGLVDKLVSESSGLPAAYELARRITSAAPGAVRESLSVLRSALDPDAETARLKKLSADAAARNAKSQDFLEGAQAFVEKRSPNWTGT